MNFIGNIVNCHNTLIIAEHWHSVKWEMEYTIQNSQLGVDGAFPATTTVSGETTIPASTTDRSHVLTEVGTITGTNVDMGAIIAFRFRRIASSGTEPSSDPFALQVGFHYEIDTVGSRTEYTK